jgi:dolichyl-phosphate-mannose-protein mannosyltransferase
MNREGGAVLALIVIAAVAVRLLALDVPGHAGDVRVMVRWAEHMAEHGSLGFYGADNAIYPAFLYLLWPLGLLLDGEALSTAIKGLSIPFDVAIGLMLAEVLRRRGLPGVGLGAAALYLLNPGAVVAGSMWGQVDNIGTLAFLGALLAAAARRDGLAGALAVLATLLKPQFGLAVLAVGVAAAIRTGLARRPAPLLRAVLGGAVTYALVTAPLALAPERYLGLLGQTAQRQPMASLYAFNPWGLIAGFDTPDDGYAAVGLVLLVAGIVVSLLPLRRRRDLGTMLAVGGMLALALYFLPTRVHERYLFPVLALLAPLAAAEARLRTPYIVLSLGYALTLVYTLIEIAELDLAEPIPSLLVSTPAVWIITLAMLASAAAFFIAFLTERRSTLDASGNVVRQASAPPP